MADNFYNRHSTFIISVQARKKRMRKSDH